MNSLGVIVGVDGDIAQVGMYNMSNEAQYLWDGKLLMGPKVGVFLTVKQNDIRIITTVISEKIIDQQNTVKSVQFDNRYSKNSINRIVCLKTQGVIDRGKFQLTSEYVPMIGNEVILTSSEDLNAIYDINDGEPTISIGKSVREKQVIRLPINKFFASHIGIFGNTGSGKSNTLHKLYLELFRSKYRKEIFKKSKFFVIDFNGEYTQEKQFGVKNHQDKKVFNIDTRSGKSDRLPVTKDYLFNPDILAILFDARPATQIPFLRSAMREFKKIDSADMFFKEEWGLLKKLILDFKEVNYEPIDQWIQVVKSYRMGTDLLDWIERGYKPHEYRDLSISYTNERREPNNKEILEEILIISKGEFNWRDKRVVSKIKELRTKMINGFNDLNELEKLKVFLEFERIYVTAWHSVNSEYINPLFKRIESSLNSLSPIIELIDNEHVDNNFKCLNIINLVHSNQEIKRLVPMILSKMIYDRQKELISKSNKIERTCHLIIDEAHNILNAEFRHNGDSWQDFRLSVFEEIIKEGRKFGFFLTLASQRPADISPTIISQLHNFFVHRLVNENDLRMLENTMPTLDKSSYKEISSLGQGEAIITGNAMRVPVIVKVSKEENNRPKSDDIILTDLWEN